MICNNSSRPCSPTSTTSPGVGRPPEAKPRTKSPTPTLSASPCEISTVEFATLSWRTLLGVDWGLILPKAESWNSPPLFAASPCEMSSVGCAAGIPVRPPLSEGPGSSADASASGVAGAAGGVEARKSAPRRYREGVIPRGPPHQSLRYPVFRISIRWAWAAFGANSAVVA